LSDVNEIINSIVNNIKNEVKSSPPSLIEIIKSIDMAYHKDWEKNKLDFAKSILSRTWAGIPLPVLSLCGRGTQEIRYSTYLAYFLDSSKPHGLGTKYLDGILEYLNIEGIDTYNSRVDSEKWLGKASGKEGLVSCFCDIFIESKAHLIFIEQKINSGESSNPNSETSQLLRYDEAINENPEFSGKNQTRIYLTPTGKISQKSPNWQSLSYIDLVDIGLNLLHTGKLSYTAKENLKRFLLDILIGPFKKTEDKIQNIVLLAEKAITSSEFKNRIEFDQITNQNAKLIEILLEG